MNSSPALNRCQDLYTESVTLDDLLAEIVCPIFDFIEEKRALSNVWQNGRTRIGVSFSSRQIFPFSLGLDFSIVITI